MLAAEWVVRRGRFRLENEDAQVDDVWKASELWHVGGLGVDVG